jgi:hypothetical protein
MTLFLSLPGLLPLAAAPLWLLELLSISDAAASFQRPCFLLLLTGERAWNLAGPLLAEFLVKGEAAATLFLSAVRLVKGVFLPPVEAGAAYGSGSGAGGGDAEKKFFLAAGASGGSVSGRASSCASAASAASVSSPPTPYSNFVCRYSAT